MNYLLNPSRLTPRERETAKRLVAAGVQQATVARAFGVASSVIHYAIHGAKKKRGEGR